MASIKLQPSRFALLKVEDEDEETEKQSKRTDKGESQSKNAQKKSKKKKKENSELKHLAFGQGGKHGHANGRVGEAPEKQWEEWQKLDQEYTQDSFEKDLQQALLLSKLEVEQTKQKKKSPPPGLGTTPVDATGGAGDGKDSKKKKKKEKQQNTMSLEQFNQRLDEKKTYADELETLLPSSLPQPATKVPSSEADPAFFKTVDSDVSRILRQEKMQEEYKKQYAAESVITAKYHDEIKKKDKEIEFLRATLKKQEEEYKQVKKRNKQLCVILAQGEMKDKAEVLMQVDQLTGVKDELTEQVSELTAELEKERSKVHTLKAELEKNKSAKHK